MPDAPLDPLVTRLLSCGTEAIVDGELDEAAARLSAVLAAARALVSSHTSWRHPINPSVVVALRDALAAADSAQGQPDNRAPNVPPCPTCNGAGIITVGWPPEDEERVPCRTCRPVVGGAR